MSREIKAEAMADYERRCLVCGNSPTVVFTRKNSKRIIHESNLCGVCCFGEAACVDPNEWSEGEI